MKTCPPGGLTHTACHTVLKNIVTACKEQKNCTLFFVRLVYNIGNWELQKLNYIPILGTNNTQRLGYRQNNKKW